MSTPHLRTLSDLTNLIRSFPAKPKKVQLHKKKDQKPSPTPVLHSPRSRGFRHLSKSVFLSYLTKYPTPRFGKAITKAYRSRSASLFRPLTDEELEKLVTAVLKQIDTRLLKSNTPSKPTADQRDRSSPSSATIEIVLQRIQFLSNEFSDLLDRTERASVLKACNDIRTTPPTLYEYKDDIQQKFCSLDSVPLDFTMFSPSTARNRLMPLQAAKPRHNEKPVCNTCLEGRKRYLFEFHHEEYTLLDSTISFSGYSDVPLTLQSVVNNVPVPYTRLDHIAASTELFKKLISSLSPSAFSCPEH